MKPKIAFIVLLFFIVSLGFSSQIDASGSSDYVIFRANISPMYIMNSTAPIQVLAIPFKNNKPVYATVQIHINIQGINVNYTYNQVIPVEAGMKKTIYLPAMNGGHYDIILYAQYMGIKSRVVDQDFGVVPAPLPYELTFNNDGSQIIFKSKVLNATGQIDPTTTFRLEIYLWDGNTQNLVNIYQNITKITINVPRSWRHGILIVDVIDKYGWHNGMGINLQEFQLQGFPVEYDYEQSRRYPAAGHNWLWYFGVAFIALVLLYIGKRVMEGGRNAEE